MYIRQIPVGILSVLATSTRTVGFSSVVGAESVKGQNAEGTVSPKKINTHKERKKKAVIKKGDDIALNE